MYPSPQRRVLCLCVGCVLGSGVPAFCDATVWTNGNGVGGATVRVTGANGITAMQEFLGAGGNEWISSTDSTAAVNVSWDPNWQAHLWGFATQQGASFGSTASVALISSIDLLGQFEPPGPSGASFRLFVSTFTVSLSQRNEANVHYALLAVPPDAIPQGFLGTADDLVTASVITSDQILTQFSGSFPLSESWEELVDLGGSYDLENLTLLAWVHGSCVESCLIPAVSTWGLTVLALLILSGATIVLMQRTVLPAYRASA